MFSLMVFSLLSALLSLSDASSIPKSKATVCNGRAELCERPYGSVTYLTAHNSFGASKDIFALARNQEIDVSAQLQMGVRALQGQAHLKDGNLRFCHTDCALFDGGLVVDYLKKVKAFLDVSPNEVVTLIFTNPDKQSIPGMWQPAFDGAGLTSLAYVPPSRTMKRSDWPTLGELIDSQKRVVVFLDEGADGSDGGFVDFILPEFQMIWEDPFSPQNNTFPCKIDRTAGPLSDNDHMYLINHNLNRNIIPIGDGVLLPDFANAKNTNSAKSILAHASNCAPFAEGRAPNFVLLDFVDIGESIKTVNQLNGF
ncbi:PLC-like phosphodiesterase [Crepidotus variabilis]|uniref:PLC-like phosphodiesterase n=1 Tax=Crepidotus variabilis TaxID=179855 RepID=A0A9P6JRG1_9AGAR|nr:PLC-like phosphodiesterase [Crepidotus variabilis]